MILEKLVIENFRPFRGNQEIIFSTSRRKNVTLIHAENGFGKTALLNALLWGFYGHEGLTPDLEKPERNIHEGLAADCKVPTHLEARVTILFEDDDEKYSLTRSITLAQERDDHRKTRLELEVMREGATIRIDRAKDKILSIMPQGISNFLFFNGERIDHLAMDRHADQITNAIKQMLGLKLLQTTIKDLEHQNVRGRLNKDLSENTDEETMRLLSQQEELEETLASHRTNRSTCLSEQSAARGEMKNIDAKLEANQRTRNLQQRRNSLDSEKEEQEQIRGDASQQLSSTIADRGYMLFAEELVKRGKKIATRLRGEEKIPARVLTSFVEDLLAAQKCICGCELSRDSPEYLRVKALLNQAGDHHFNEAVSNLDHAIGAIESNTPTTREAISTKTRRRSQATHRIRQISEELADIHAQIGDDDDEEVEQLEQSRNDLELRIRGLRHQEGGLDENISGTETEIERVRRAIEDSEQKADAAAKAQRRLNALHSVTQLLEEILGHEMRDLRTVLNTEIDSHFQKIIDRECWAELSEDFVLRIMKRVGAAEQEIDVAQSSGQRQLTSLVFIASLVALARNRSDLPTILSGLDGGIFPMVMDAPFSNLGDAYRAGVAKWIPTLAPQVIILVASSHYQGIVENSLDENKIGKRYLLRYHGPEKPSNSQPRITLSGDIHSIYETEEREEYTRIVEIND